MMFANIIWPALYLISRLLSIWVILGGLFIEFFFLWGILGIEARRAVLAGLAMNLASATLGIVLIGALGLAVVLPFRSTFGVGAWIATIVVGVMVNACLESLVVSKWFKKDFGKRDFWLLVAANAMTMGIAYGSLGLFPLRNEL